MSSLLSASSAMAMDDAMPSMCLSPQDKLKGSSSSKSSLAAAVQRKKTATGQASMSMAVAVSALAAMDFEMVDASSTMDMDDVDLDLELVDDDSSDHDMDDAGWVSDDNLRALEFDDRLNQDIDWVAHDDVETSLKLELVPSSSDDVQDFAFDPSSFLSPLRGGLSFDDSDMSSSFAESLSVDTPPPSFGTTSHDAEKLLMSFDTMNFTIPSPTSSSTRKRASLFAKKEAGDDNAADKSSAATSSAATASRASLATTGSMSPSLKQKAGAAATDEARTEDARASLSKLSIPTPEFLGVLNLKATMTPTTTTSSHHQSVDAQRKIGSYSPEARRLRIQKFHEKRKNRTWKKSIKYDCRKKLADDRPRIKGRFVRVHENASDVKEEDSCSATSSSSGGSPAPSSAISSPCGGSPVKVEPVTMPTVTPVTVPAIAVALLAAQLQPVPPVAVPAAPAAAPTSVPAPASVLSSS